MRLIAIGRLKASAEAELFAGYNKRLRPPLTVVELSEGVGAPMEIKRREAVAICAALRPADYAVALDQDADLLTSMDLARQLGAWQATGKHLTFLIGGAEGLSSSVLHRAQAVLSLGTLTWPHTLVRVMLVEQLYRAQSIIAGHPYHRGGRPD